MKAPIARQLANLAEHLRATYSNPDKGWKQNANNEVRAIAEVLPLSDQTGAVILQGVDTGLQTIYFCWYNQYQHEGKWQWMLPSYDKIAGMTAFVSLIRKVESRNYKTNTEQPSYERPQIHTDRNNGAANADRDR